MARQAAVARGSYSYGAFESEGRVPAVYTQHFHYCLVIIGIVVLNVNYLFILINEFYNNCLV